MTFLILLSFLSYSQKYYINHEDTIKKRPKLSIGTKHCGIGFGNFRKYSGIRFSLIDHDTLNNGISLNVSSFDNRWKKTNGLEISLFFSSLDELNGINFCPLISDIDDGKGLTISGLYSDGLYFKGAQFSGGLSMTYYVNGLCFSGIANIVFEENGVLAAGLINVVDSIVKGVAISGLYQKTENFNGLCIAPINISESGKGLQFGIFNKSKSLRGIQIGLININRRKKYFKVMPFLNFSFKK